MSKESISQPQRRSRGRPKKNVNYATLAGFTNLNRPSCNISVKRKQVEDDISVKRKQVEDEPDEIQIISTNSVEQSTQIQIKKSKLLDDKPKRSQPHRAARFTESYGGSGSPDVVIVSDEENQEESESESDSDCSPIPSPICIVKTKEELELWEENVQRLKKQLNDEEMKLVLLLKLKESQKAKDAKPEASASPLPSAALPPTNLHSLNSQKSSSISIIPKNKVQQPLPNKQLLPNRFIPIKKEMKSVPVSTNGPHRYPSPLPVALVKNGTGPNTTSVSQSSQLKSNTLNQYPLLKNLSNQITVTPVNTPIPSTHSQQQQQQQQQPVVNKTEEKIDPEAIYQRQAAAKLALRKQLEKQLLQIPLPKAPPMKLNFFPNANSIEFLCLLGLDCVVDFLTKTKKDPPREKPLCCAQCSTDFTCSWKWKEVDKNGEKVFSVFCEACINSNIRKALKAQHTSSLKAAFLKALQQEKEIDRLSQTLPQTVSKSHSSTREPRQNSHLPVPAPAHQARNSSAFSLPKSGTTLTYIPKPSPALNHANLNQVGKLNPHFQSLLQAQAQHLLASGVPLHPNVLSLTSFVPPSSHHNQAKSSTGPHDFRRQYQSNRTQSPSISPASSSWKA